MLERTYRNFDLLIEGTGAGGYRGRVLASPAGETGPVPVTMPFSDLEVENFLLKIGRPRRHAVRGVNSPEAAAVRQFGGRLFDAVFHDDLRETLTRSLDEVEGHDAGLRLRLRLADCPELADLPWEYIYDPRARRFLALSQWTPVVRYLDLRRRIPPLSVRPPLRILMMAANPTDFDPLNVDGEWAKVRDALGELQRAGRVQVDRVPGGTLADLRRQLRRGSYHVFHYVGHGRYNPETGDGELALEGLSGRAQLISGVELGARLSDHRSLRLAVLNSCEGARGGRTDPYAGSAQSLLYQGIPAVVAMQFEITDHAAITFAQNLYEAVADGLPLDAAMAEARNAILDEPNPVEWATPVLYLRAPDGRIFDVTEPDTPRMGTTEPARTDPRLGSPLLDQARAQHSVGNIDAAIRLLDDLLTSEPAHSEAAELRATALHEQQLADTYRQAAEAEAAADWPTAVARYTEILDTDPAYRDAAARKEACERRQQIADLQAELRRLAAAERWQAVLDADEQLRRLDPATADRDGLATRARQALQQAEKTADLDRRYAQAHAHEDDADWEAAFISYREIVDIDASYRDAAQRRDACRNQIKVTALRAELDRRSAAREAQEQARREAEEQAAREADEEAHSSTTPRETTTEPEKETVDSQQSPREEGDDERPTGKHKTPANSNIPTAEPASVGRTPESSETDPRDSATAIPSGPDAAKTAPLSASSRGVSFGLGPSIDQFDDPSPCTQQTPEDDAHSAEEHDTTVADTGPAEAETAAPVSPQQASENEGSGSETTIPPRPGAPRNDPSSGEGKSSDTPHFDTAAREPDAFSASLSDESHQAQRPQEPGVRSLTDDIARSGTYKRSTGKRAPRSTQSRHEPRSSGDIHRDATTRKGYRILVLTTAAAVVVAVIVIVIANMGGDSPNDTLTDDRTTASSHPSPSAPATSSMGPTPLERATLMIDRLPQEIRASGCHARQRTVANVVLPEVACGGNGRIATYLLFDTAENMNSWFDQQHGGAQPGDCTSGLESEDQLGSFQVEHHQGRVSCQGFNGIHFQWTDDTALIGGSVLVLDINLSLADREADAYQFWRMALQVPPA